MKKLLLLSVLFLSLQAQAQKIHLRSGELLPAENMGRVERFSDWQPYQFEGQTYCILQFSRSTSSAERQQISKETGITFYDYIPRFAFIASLPAAMNVNDLGKYGIKSLLPYEARYKLPKQLLDRPLPSWIQLGNGMVEILVYTYQKIAAETVVAELAKNHAVFVEWQAPCIAKVRMNVNQIEQMAQQPWVKLLIATDAPGTPENDQGRTDHRMNTIDADYATGMHYDGTGVSVAVGDDGGIGPHIDFRGRLFFHPANIGMGGTHCDHVSGIVAGAGNMNPVMKGNGKGADLHIYDDYQNLSNAPTHYNTQGVRITSNSLGQGCNDGYNNSSVSADNLINSKFSLMSIHSAGNSGQDNCANVGQGYFTITGGYKAGKNVIAVGNVLKDDAIAASSSRGPSEDGRIKPEVCAVGTSVNSTQPDDTYDNFTGTSMACPAVAGTMASLWQAYRDTHAGADPNSALMKCLLLNTADDLGNRHPDFIYGFGRINARRAVNVMNANQYFIDSVDNGGIKSFNVNVPPNTKQLKVMMYYHDITGNPANAIVLVNNLDMTVVDFNNVVYKPWVLNNAPNVAALSSVAVRERDSLNNAEQVTIDSLPAGSYTIRISGNDVPQGPQVFVITYEFISDSITLTYPQGGESFANGYAERIRWDAYGNNYGNFTLEYSSNAGAAWNVIANNIAGDRRYYNWTPPANLNTGQMLMRISRGAVSDVSDTLFTVIDVPTGLTVDTACGSDFHLVWNASPFANGYKIYQLGTKYMQEIGTSATNDFYITNGVNTTDTFYFAVASLETSNGANGRKCIAYRKLPGEINCLDDAYNVETMLPFSNVYPCASGGNIQVKVKVKNIGLRNMPNIPVFYQVNAMPVVSEIIPGTLNIGDSVIYTFTATVNMLNAGIYNVKTWVHTGGDINNNNDTTMATASVMAPVTFFAPGLVQDFEGAAFPPAGWQVFDYDNSVKWQKIFCLSGATAGNTHAAYMDFFNYNSKNAVDDLETPMLDLTNVTADSVFLTFDLAHAYGPLETDTLSMWVSPICNNNYSPLNYKKWGVDLATVGMMNTIFSPALPSQWRNDQVDLSAYKGQKVFVRFRGSNKHGNNLYIDNVNLLTKNAWATGVHDINSSAYSVYPNPSDGHYALEISGNAGKTLSYTIYNVAGQVILTENIIAASDKTIVPINISDYASGFYLLEVNDGQHSEKIKLTRY
ncbi:MAG: S8 family peptidase [Chitinophagaceae bacterium]|nr:S8 family peptidase [Chitinophagaceae bacterium]